MALKPLRWQAVAFCVLHLHCTEASAVDCSAARRSLDRQIEMLRNLTRRATLDLARTRAAVEAISGGVTSVRECGPETRVIQSVPRSATPPSEPGERGTRPSADEAISRTLETQRRLPTPEPEQGRDDDIELIADIIARIREELGRPHPQEGVLRSAIESLAGRRPR